MKSSIIYIFFLAVVFILIWGLTALTLGSIRYSELIPPPSLKVVSPEQTYKDITWIDMEKVVFIDVRSPKEYNELHASGSINIPIADLYDKKDGEIPREGKDIYLICTSGRLAAVAYQYLQFHGFTNLKHVEGGVNNWAAKRLPTVTKEIKW